MGRFGALPVDQPPLLPLPPHLARLPWPTETWPRADIDPRADRTAVDRLLDHAFSDPEPDDLGRTNAVVVVQHGAVVAERYRQDVEANRAFISWSMAKSITSCLVGILVQQGKLDISQPIPVKEWSVGDKRCRITIDQMLRMTDGLRFREAEHLGSGNVRYYPGAGWITRARRHHSQKGRTELTSGRSPAVSVCSIAAARSVNAFSSARSST